MRLPRPCIKCQILHQDRGDYCEKCRTDYERQRDKRRYLDPLYRERKRLLYSSGYRAAREILKANATHCHICKQAFTDRSQITADHLLPGDPASPLAPAHKGCNSSRGNKPLKNL